MADDTVAASRTTGAAGTRIAVLYIGIGDYIDRPPDLALPPSYLYPENFRIPFSPIIFLLEKRHIMRLDPRRMPRVAPTTGSGSGPRGTTAERPE